MDIPRKDKSFPEEISETLFIEAQLKVKNKKKSVLENEIESFLQNAVNFLDGRFCEEHYDVLKQALDYYYPGEELKKLFVFFNSLSYYLKIPKQIIVIEGKSNQLVEILLNKIFIKKKLN